eukprot:scaffold461394_cov18-Prasinocladus_malaysianus.AAC.1
MSNITALYDEIKTTSPSNTRNIQSIATIPEPGAEPKEAGRQILMMICGEHLRPSKQLQADKGRIFGRVSSR